MVFQHESEKLGFSITIFICKSPKFSWAMASQRQPRHHYCRTVAFRRSRAGADDICCELGPPGTKSCCSWKNPRDIFSTTVGLSKIPSGKRLHNYGKSPFSIGKSTINHHFQELYNKLPEGSPFHGLACITEHHGPSPC